MLCHFYQKENVSIAYRVLTDTADFP